MSPVKRYPFLDDADEISALIETLHQTEQRIEELTGGQVDTAANRSGRTVLLQHAHNRLRESEAVEQAAVLNALPAHVALLDAEGSIVSVNDTWRQFGSANDLLSPKFGVGMNYLELCDNANGANSVEAREAAAGLRSVLAGASKHYSLEYPCHSPTEHRWFQMSITPLADGVSVGAVVMHLDVTEKHRSEIRLRNMDQKYRTVFKASSDAIMILDEHGFSEVNGATLHMFGCTANSDLLGKQPSDVSPLVQAGGEASAVLADRYIAQALREGSLQFEWVFRRLNNVEFLTEVLLTAMEVDGAMAVQATVRDITERNAAQEELIFKNTMLQTQIEASLDAVMVVDGASRIMSYNRNFISMWQISSTILGLGDIEMHDYGTD